MSLEGWEEEEISIAGNDDDNEKKSEPLSWHEQQNNDEIPLEIIDYSCLNTFETIVQKVELFLLNTLQTHEDLRSLWKCRNTCNSNNESMITKLQQSTAIAFMEQEQNNKECSNYDENSQSKAKDDSNESNSNDSLKSCQSFTSPASLFLKEEKSKFQNSNKDIFEEEPIVIIGKTFVINASSASRSFYSNLYEYQSNIESQPSYAISVEIHLHDHFSPITQLYHVPFFILIKRAHVQETCNTSEAKYYLCILVTAMNNVLSSLSSMALLRFFAPFQKEQSTLPEMCYYNEPQSESSLLTSHYSWHETCVPCFTPIGHAEDGLYIGTTPLCPVFCNTHSSLTPFDSSNVNHTSSAKEMKRCDQQKENHEQENLLCLNNSLVCELLTPRLCTEFSFTTHSTLPFNIFDLSVLSDVFRLHLGPQSRICTANSDNICKINCISTLTSINANNTNGLDTCGICISVQRLYTLAMPYRFQPPHDWCSVSEMTSTVSANEEPKSFLPTPLSWNEVIRRENDRLKIICGVECYPIGTREPPITHLNVRFNWHALNDKDVDELNTCTSNHDFTSNSEIHDDLDPFDVHRTHNVIVQQRVNDNVKKTEWESSLELHERSANYEEENTYCKSYKEECNEDDSCTSADTKCTITLSTGVIQSDKLHHLLNDQVHDAWDEILSRLQYLLMHPHKSNHTTKTTSNTKDDTTYKTREEVCHGKQRNTRTELMSEHLSEVDYEKLEMLANQLFATNPCAFASHNATDTNNNKDAHAQYDYEAEATLQRFYIDQLWSESLESSREEEEQHKWEEECVFEKEKQGKLRKGHTSPSYQKDIRSTYVPCSLLNRFAQLCIKHIRRAEEIFTLWHLCIAQLTSLIMISINEDINNNDDDDDDGDDMEKKAINVNAIHNILKMIGLPERDSPVDMTQSLLVQKLQMLTYCLRLLLLEESGKSHNRFYVKEKYSNEHICLDEHNKKANWSDGWSDDNDDNNDNSYTNKSMNKDCNGCTSADSSVNVTKNIKVHTSKCSSADHMCLITNGEAIVIPPVIPEFPHTSDALLEHALTLQNFTSTVCSIRQRELWACAKDNTYGNKDASLCLLDQYWLNHDALYNDMCLFLYVNNAHHGRVVCFADFIHWHSPRDFTWPDDKLLCKHNEYTKKTKHTEQQCNENGEECSFSTKQQNNVESYWTESATEISSKTETKTMSEYHPHRQQEETSYSQNLEVDDNLYLSERMQYHTNENQNGSNHIWWYLWKRARPRTLEEIVHDAFNAREEIISLCKWLHTSVQQSDLLQEVLKATIANVLHPILCHRINGDKHTASLKNTRINEKSCVDRICAIKPSNVASIMRHYVMKITEHINSLNRMHTFEQAQSIVSVAGECEYDEEENKAQMENIISLYWTIWKDVCKLNYVLSHALAVQCVLGEPTVFTLERTVNAGLNTKSKFKTPQRNQNRERNDIVQKLSLLVNDEQCNEEVEFTRCNINWKEWINIIAPRLYTKSDSKVKNVQAIITCFAERPLGTCPCYQQMTIKYNNVNKLRISLALSKEVREARNR